MPRELTLEREARLLERERAGYGSPHQCRNPLALGAKRSASLVKGGIARAPGVRDFFLS